MRFPAAFCGALLACIAISLAVDETRPKRHLHHLTGILNKFKYPVLGFNNVILKPVPTTRFLPEKVFVNPAPIIRTPALNLRPIHGVIHPPVFRHRLPCPPLPMVRLPPPPQYLIPFEPSRLVVPPPEIAMPPRFAPIPPSPPVIEPLPQRFAPIPPPSPVIAPLPPRFAPIPPPSPVIAPLSQRFVPMPPPLSVIAPLPPRFAPVPHKSAPIAVPPLRRKIVPVIPPATPKIIIPSFKYIYDQKNQDGSITTTYSKDGKDVLVVTTNELPPPVLVERVEKIVTDLPCAPAIPCPFGTDPMVGQVPIPLPNGPFSIHHRIPIRPLSPLLQPQPAIKTKLFPLPRHFELKNKTVAIETPLSIPRPPPHIVERLENIANIHNSGYSLKLSNEEGYVQQGDDKIYYSRLLPSRFLPLASNPERKPKTPHQYTVITEDRSTWDGIEEGSMRRHHEANERPHYGGPHLPTWVDNGYSYRLVDDKPDVERFGNRDDSVTVTRKKVGVAAPNIIDRPGMRIDAETMQKNTAGYIYDQKNQDGSITTTYSKDGKDVLVVTTNEFPPPVLVERVEKIVTEPFAPAIPRLFGTDPIVGQVPIALPNSPFSIHHRTPIRPLSPLLQPQSAIKTKLMPLPPTELLNKSSFGIDTKDNKVSVRINKSNNRRRGDIPEVL